MHSVFESIDVQEQFENIARSIQKSIPLSVPILCGFIHSVTNILRFIVKFLVVTLYISTYVLRVCVLVPAMLKFLWSLQKLYVFIFSAIYFSEYHVNLETISNLKVFVSSRRSILILTTGPRIFLLINWSVLKLLIYFV